ncbi:MAG: DUF58 domain-containing protein [Clostridia bacterium]|nr:DUF58 domain-containing protein [Clostridia bacterium]
MIRSRVSYALSLLAGWAFYVFYKEWLSWFVLLLLVALPFVSLTLSWVSARTVKVSVRAEPPAAGKGETVRFVVGFANRGVLPVARAGCTLRVRNALGPWEKPRGSSLLLAGKSSRSVEYPVASDYAGKLECRVEKIGCYDFLGLFRCRRLPDLEAWAFVMPRAVPILPELTAEPVPDWDGEHVHPGKPGEDPSETFDIRAYREGDSLRSIHWKLSGRTGELMVREFAQPVSDAVELLLDLCGSMEGQDLLLDALCSLHLFLEEAGVTHRVTWFDGAKEELRTRLLTTDEDWTGALGAILSAKGSRGAALTLRLRNEEGPRIARVLYLAGAFGKAERDMLTGLPDALALVAEGGGETQGTVKLRRETLREDLSDLTI